MDTTLSQREENGALGFLVGLAVGFEEKVGEREGDEVELGNHTVGF